MKKVLSFAIIFGLIVLVGMAAALPLIGSNAGFRNPGNAEIGGNVAIGGSLTVGGAIVPQYYEIPIYGLGAASVDMDIYTATASAKIVGISEVHGVAATGNPTVTVKKCTGTQAPSSGVAMVPALNLSTTAYTIVTGTPNTDGSQKINATERLTLDFTGAPTALASGAITIKMQRI